MEEANANDTNMSYAAVYPSANSHASDEGEEYSSSFDSADENILREEITHLQELLECKTKRLTTIHELKERQLKLAFERKLQEITLEYKRDLEVKNIEHMEEMLKQRQLCLSQATTIRSQLAQLIEYQSKLTDQHTAILDYQNSIIVCHARLAMNHSQMMHYQAQLLLQQTQNIILQNRIADFHLEENRQAQLAAERERNNNEDGIGAGGATENDDLGATAPPEP